MSRFVRSMCALFVIVGMLAIPFSGPVGDVVAEEEEVTMYIGVVQTPDSLNPLSMALSISYTINFLLYDTLNSVDRDLNAGPQLATSWESSEDGKVWTYNLAEDAYWHDGEQVTADDVNWTFNLVKTNPRGSCDLWVDYIEGVTDIRALDDFTVQITTSRSKATMLSIMIPILPEHIWSQIDENKLDTVEPFDKTAFPTGPVGSGPLKLVEYESTLGFIRMQRYDDYFIDTVKVNEVLFKIFDTASVMYTSLTSGEIDVAMGVPPEVWDEALDEPELDGQSVKALSLFELGINCASEQMREDFPQASDNLETTNRSVRQAIAMATNKTQIVSGILGGLADEGVSVIPKATQYWFWTPEEDEKWPYDLERAANLLEDAGYKYINDDEVRENETSGELLDFSFYYRSGKNADLKAANQISDALALIGIKADPEPLSEMNLYNYWYGCKYDLYIWAWDTDVDPSFMLSVMTTDQIPDSPTDFTAWSDCFWSNAEYDAMYEQQLYAVDPEERQTIVRDMQRLLYIECPYVVLYYPHGLYAYNIEKFTNYPDMVSHPGTTPGTMWFFFDVTPSDQWVDPVPPTEVYAGSDRSCVVNQTLSFTGLATDENDPIESLTWEWLFEDVDGNVSLTGRTVDYKFENVGLINVTLTVTDPGDLSGSDTLVVNVTEPLEGSGWIVGYVKTPGGLPIVGAIVTARTSSQETNSTGAYEINIAAGTYTVNVSKSGFTSASEEVTAIADETVWQNFTLSPTSGDIKGQVYDYETGDAISGATVKVTVGSQVKTFTSNATGYFEFNDVVAGVYTVNATKSGFYANSTEVTVVAGATANATIYLEPVPPADEPVGLSTAAVVAIGVVVLAAIALTAMYLMKRKKSAPPPSSEDQAPSVEELPPPSG